MACRRPAAEAARDRARPARRRSGIGDRILARTEEAGQGFVAHPMKKLANRAELVLGVVRKEGERFWLSPVDKRERRELADRRPQGRRARRSGPVRTVGTPAAGHRAGRRGARRPVRAAQLQPDRDPQARPSRTNSATKRSTRRIASSKLPLGEREDLTHLPIVAIDPADARDHDDAIWAAPDDDPDNRAAGRRSSPSPTSASTCGPARELDREARARGNSVYFPDRVVPMLPEELSADICSLKQGQVRAAMACHLTIAKDGTLKSWRFTRAKICVAANIAYENAQAAIDAAGEDRTEVSSSTCSMPEVEGTIPANWSSRRSSRCGAAGAPCSRRATSASRSSSTFPNGGWCSTKRGGSCRSRRATGSTRTGWSRTIMIAANVAAARALEAKKAPVMYRVHEAPSREKLVALKDYLATFEIEFALGQVIKPATFNRIIERRRRQRRARRDHGASASHPDAGALRARATGPLRAGAGDLRPLHLADPPLRRPARPPRAGQRLPARRGRAAAGRG